MAMPMKKAVLWWIGIVLVFAEFSSAQQKSVREELAERQKVGGYALGQGWGCFQGAAQVIAPLDRKTLAAACADKDPKDFFNRPSPDGRYVVVRTATGCTLRNQTTGVDEWTNPGGSCWTHSWSPDSRQFVFLSAGRVQIYDLEQKTYRYLREGIAAEWSPDGSAILVVDRKWAFLLDPAGSKQKRLFKMKDVITDSGEEILWSPDSQFLSFRKWGGESGGGFIPNCLESKRVWVWRVRDGASDWLLNQCKAAPGFRWVRMPGPSTPE